MTRWLRLQWIWIATGCGLLVLIGLFGLALIGYFASDKIFSTAEPDFGGVVEPDLDDVAILSHSVYYDTLGFLHVVGEVKNNLPIPVSPVSVVATFYDEQNKIVTVLDEPVASEIISTNGRVPFDIMLHNPLTVFRYELDLQVGEELAAPLTGLTVVDEYSELNNVGFLYVLDLEGELWNNTGSPVRFVKVIVTMYDEAGTVIGTSFAYATPNSLLPDGVTSFNMTINLPRPITTYRLQADGEWGE